MEKHSYLRSNVPHVALVKNVGLRNNLKKKNGKKYFAIYFIIWRYFFAFF